MGNHEYCPSCGEDDFHRGQPCDPAKVAAVKAEEERCAALKATAVARMRLALGQAGIKHEIDLYGNAVIRWTNYSEKTNAKQDPR